MFLTHVRFLWRLARSSPREPRAVSTPDLLFPSAPRVENRLILAVVVVYGHNGVVLAAQALNCALRQLPLKNGKSRDHWTRYRPIVVLPIHANHQIWIVVQLWIGANVLVAQQVLTEHFIARAVLRVEAAAQGHADVDAAVEQRVFWLLEVRVQWLWPANRTLHAVWALWQARAVSRFRVLFVNRLLSLWLTK